MYIWTYLPLEPLAFFDLSSMANSISAISSTSDSAEEAPDEVSGPGEAPVSSCCRFLSIIKITMKIST